MKSVYLVRHGQTLWNAAGIFQGWKNSDLSHLGVEQAKFTGSALTDKGIQSIYSSDLGRTVQTTEFINESLGLEVTLDEGLRERNLGSFEGLVRKDVKATSPELHQKYYGDDIHFAPEGGESRKEHHDRFTHAVNTIVANTDKNTILLVTHGGCLDMFFRYVTGAPLQSKRKHSLKNCAINLFEFDQEGWSLNAWGNTSHIKTDSSY